jgi:hypothetical protein
MRLKMLKLLNAKDFDKLPDAVLLHNREIDGHFGALLYVLSSRACLLGVNNSSQDWVLFFVPMDYIDTLVTIFDDNGLHLSYG